MSQTGLPRHPLPEYYKIMEHPTSPPVKSAIVVGSGVVGMLVALLLTRRNWSVTLVDPKANSDLKFELPYVCSQFFISLLHTELPDVEAALYAQGAKSISVAELVRRKFSSFHATEQDEETRFLCCSRSLLFQTLKRRLHESDVKVDLRPVTGLIYSEGAVTGVEFLNQTQSSELVIDATGFNGERGSWINKLGLSRERFEIYGPELVSISRFFRVNDPNEIVFTLARGENFRGGIYPLEGNLFAVAIIVPENVLAQHDTPEVFFRLALSRISGAPEILSRSMPTGGIQVLRGLQNKCSDFYLSSPSDAIAGLYPIGDSLQVGNPVYGRGLSISALQISALMNALDLQRTGLDHLKIRSLMVINFRRVRNFWLDGARADETSRAWNRLLVTWLRHIYIKAVLPQVDANPVLMRNFLYSYQLLLPAWRIARPWNYVLGLIHLLSSWSPKMGRVLARCRLDGQ
jgi:2-polyprenyl-6-methoxyphenol hydroxylase-like FAD-dependent oxidoreductase